ncbi:hypothetical protein OAA30_00315 [bacterium]|nr:hypothetical protein [bacterium]
MVEWNYLTTTIAINNFSLYTNTQYGRDTAIYDICDRVNAYVPCNNKEKILKKFEENAKKTKSIQEFKEIATQLLIEINTNWKESL